MSTIKNTLSNITSDLRPYSSTPGLDALLILEYATGYPRTELLQNIHQRLSFAQKISIQRHVWQRIYGYPLAYSARIKKFYGRDFYITPGVLVPRPETEDLVTYTYAYLSKLPYSPSILEIGTGSGCVSVTLAAELPHMHSLRATDTSAYALHLASYNASLYNVREYISFVHQNLLSSPPIETPNVVVTNLPYLHRNKHTDDSIQTEPPSHLYSTHEGRGHYQALFAQMRSHFFHVPYLIGEALPDQIPELKADAERIFSEENVHITHPAPTVFTLEVHNK